MAALTQEEDKPWWEDVRDFATDKYNTARKYYNEMGSALEGQEAAPASSSPRPAEQPPPPAAAQPAPALGEQPTAAPEIDPQIGIRVATESAEAAKTASDEDKEAINKELEGIVGGPSGLDKAYEEALERLGGEQKFDPKLDRKDWGLFLMDFGMRMMAASGEWNAQLGGAMGQAGSGALGGLMGRQTAEREGIEARNEERRGAALDIAEQRTDPRGVIWTEKGAYNTRTGEYQRGPEGEILKPGMEPGASNRPFQRQVSQSALEGAGLPADVAARIAQGGAPDPAKLEFEFGKQFDKMQNDAGLLDKVPGTQVKWRDATWEMRQQWVNQRMQSIYGNMGTGPALTQPGPQAEGRSRPPVMDKY